MFISTRQKTRESFQRHPIPNRNVYPDYGVKDEALPCFGLSAVYIFGVCLWSMVIFPADKNYLHSSSSSSGRPTQCGCVAVFDYTVLEDAMITTYRAGFWLSFLLYIIICCLWNRKTVSLNFLLNFLMLWCFGHSTSFFQNPSHKNYGRNKERAFKNSVNCKTFVRPSVRQARLTADASKRLNGCRLLYWSGYTSTD